MSEAVEKATEPQEKVRAAVLNQDFQNCVEDPKQIPGIFSPFKDLKHCWKTRQCGHEENRFTDQIVTLISTCWVSFFDALEALIFKATDKDQESIACCVLLKPHPCNHVIYTEYKFSWLTFWSLGNQVSRAGM